MFPLLPEQWTPVLPLAELPDGPLALRVAGEAVVAFPDAGGRWHALLDRCPHRGAALSLGTRMSDGSLQCRYHGWRFAGDGRCLKVPLNDLSDAALARIQATAVPARELAGCLWIYTGTTAAGEPVVPDSLAGPPRQFGTYYQEWQAHWTRAVENFIDFAHPSYLHRETIGAWTHDYAERGGIAHVEVEDTDFGMVMLNFLGRRGFGFQLDWYAPNLARLHFGPANKLHVFSIPVTNSLTRVMTVRALPPGQDPAAWSDRAASVDHTILDEDREIVESQPGDIALAGDEITVATDAPTVRFRRWYRDHVTRKTATG
jgi:phenylpropionate dioxygenase-like ring-hydroxylating dioxygenase large terminal subunit